MSNKKHTFTQRLRLQLLFAAAVFILVTALSFSYLTLRTVYFTDAKMTVLAAQSYADHLDTGRTTTLPNEPEMRGYATWESIPTHFKQPFEGLALAVNDIVESTYTNENGQDVYIGIIPVQRQSGEILYFISEYGFAETENTYNEIISNFISEALWLLAFMLLALLLCVFWLLKRATEPMTMLSTWAQGLKQDKSRLPEPDFPITELDDIAHQLKQGVDRLTAFNEREKQFLKYASHELRTPQATVQACLDTLQLQLEGPQLKTVERALRANLTMSRLSAALLWLSRESTDEIKKAQVDIAVLYNQSLNENRHLIDSKGLVLHGHIQIKSLHIESDLFFIVFSNLFRNACQHTTEGDIVVTVTASSLSINNPIATIEANNQLDSFGLGLHLVSSVCEKIGWRFRFQKLESTATATVNWS